MRYFFLNRIQFSFYITTRTALGSISILITKLVYINVNKTIVIIKNKESAFFYK